MDSTLEIRSSGLDDGCGCVGSCVGVCTGESVGGVRGFTRSEMCELLDDEDFITGGK